MARKARVEYAGAVDHVLERGDRREPIFQDDADRRRFLETLGEPSAFGVEAREFVVNAAGQRGASHKDEDEDCFHACHGTPFSCDSMRPVHRHQRGRGARHRSCRRGFSGHARGVAHTIQLRLHALGDLGKFRLPAGVRRRSAARRRGWWGWPKCARCSSSGRRARRRRRAGRVSRGP